MVIDKLGAMTPMLIGGGITAISTGMMAILGLNASLLYIVICLFLAGTGTGVYVTACNTAMMRTIPPKDLNIATAIYMMFLLLGHTLSVIFSTSLLVIGAKNYLLRQSEEAGLFLSSGQLQDLAHSITKTEHTTALIKKISPEQVSQLLILLKKAFMYGFSFNMMLATLLSFITVGVILWGFRARTDIKCQLREKVM
jgi:hypothetical protein